MVRDVFLCLFSFPHFCLHGIASWESRIKGYQLKVLIRISAYIQVTFCSEFSVNLAVFDPFALSCFKFAVKQIAYFTLCKGALRLFLLNRFCSLIKCKQNVYQENTIRKIFLCLYMAFICCCSFLPCVHTKCGKSVKICSRHPANNAGKFADTL